MSAPSALHDLYLASHYDVRMPGGKRVTLRVGQAVPLVLVDWTEDNWPLVFVSACNPQSRNLPAKVNRQRMRALLERLGAQRTRVLAGAGHIPGQDWREPSLLVAGLTIEQADAIAFDFDQNAILIADRVDKVELRNYHPQWATLTAAIREFRTQPASHR